MPEDKSSNETGHVRSRSNSNTILRSTPFQEVLHARSARHQPEDFIDAANHVWCCETQEVIGPDNRRVSTDNCRPGRACYSSALKGV